MIYILFQVFLKYFHTEQLDLCLETIYKDIITVQKCVRGHFARKFCRRLKQIQQHQHRDLAEFSISLNRDCDRVYHMMLSSNDHDHHKFQKLVRVNWEYPDTVLILHLPIP